MDPAFSPAPPGFPRKFGAYLLLSPIAQGGMGDVFLASTLGVAGAVRLVVIKTLRQDLAMEDGYVNRFLDEARVVIQLQHPNISQVFDVGCIDGTHYFAMEHILGTNLRRLLDVLGKSQIRIPPPLALFIAAEVLDGLDCAHSHRHALTNEPLRVVHRDISPHNIMISLQGEVKVIDFGLAESSLKVEQTETKVVLGKIAYMPPEQARGQELDATADQFALAVVLYELLSGERFYGQRGQREIWAIAGHEGFLPDRINELDPEVGALLKRALSSRPVDRFPSCGELSRALRALLNERFPETGRATLQQFVRSSAHNEIENSEKNVRALSELALRTTPDLLASRPLTPPNANAAGADTDTGATATSLIVRPQQQRKRAMAIAAAAGASLLLLALAFVVVTNASEPETRVATVVAPPLPMVEKPVDATVADNALPVDSAPSADAAKGAEAASAKAAVVASDDDATQKRATRKRTKQTAPSWASWSLEKKVGALKKCDKPCALTVKNVIAKGGDVKQPIVDVCLPQCGIR